MALGGDEEMRFTGKLKRLMPRDLQERQLNVDIKEEKLREVTFFSFFVESTCSLLKCWQSTVAECRWEETVFPDIPQKSWVDRELTPSIFLL